MNFLLRRRMQRAT